MAFEYPNKNVLHPLAEVPFPEIPSVGHKTSAPRLQPHVPPINPMLIPSLAPDAVPDSFDGALIAHLCL